MPTKKELEEYYNKIQGIRRILEEDNGPQCTCPRTNCIWHGDCASCVRQHRLLGDHIPTCLQPILLKKIEELAKTAELTILKKTPRSAEYMDFVHERDKEEGCNR